MDILIIKLGAMGDVLRTTSLLKGIKEKYANPIIHWIVNRDSFELLKDNPLISHIHTFENNAEDIIKKLANTEFGLVASLDDEDEACHIAAKVRKKKIVGAHIQSGKKSYTDDSKEWFDMGLISKHGKDKADKLKKENKKTFQDIKASMLNVSHSEPILILNKEDLTFAENFRKIHNLKNSGLIIGLNTGAGKRWPMKSLPEEKTAELAQRLMSELHAKVILFGGPSEEKRNKKIISLAPGIIDAGCSNTVLEFAALINLCKIVVCSDTLALHIAVALKKQVVAFFAPTSAAEIELYGRGKKIVSDSGCYCCYKKEIEKKPNCIDKINVDDLFNAVKEISR